MSLRGKKKIIIKEEGKMRLSSWGEQSTAVRCSGRRDQGQAKVKP